MKPIFIIGIMAFLIMCPFVSAQLVGFTASADQAVWAIQINAPIGSTGTITITQENGDVTTGTWSYVGFPVTTASLTLGSDTSTYTYISTPVNLNMRIWNGDNQTFARQLKFGYGHSNVFWNDVLSTTIQGSPIVGYSIGSGSLITVTPELVSREKATADLNPATNEDFISTGFRWMDIGIQVALTLKDIVLAIYYWGKFFLWDNLALTISLWIAITGAISFNAGLKKKNVFYAIERFLKYQRALYDFVLARWNDLVNIISNFRAVFRI